MSGKTSLTGSGEKQANRLWSVLRLPQVPGNLLNPLLQRGFSANLWPHNDYTVLHDESCTTEDPAYIRILQLGMSGQRKLIQKVNAKDWTGLG
jgi:hypothetical protein